MKKYIITLTLFLAVTAQSQSRLFNFRDGTTLRAKIHAGDQWGPNANGVVLKVDDAIYFHDYPSGSESLAPPIDQSDATPFTSTILFTIIVWIIITLTTIIIISSSTWHT